MRNSARSCDRCKLPYMACIQSRFPTTLTAIFEDTTGSGDISHFKNSPTLVKEEIENHSFTEQENIGTQQTGKGDSGTGHWMENDNRAVLVGFTVAGIYAGPQQIQKTTHPEIFQFINDNIDY